MAAKTAKTSSASGSLLELVLIVAVALGLALGIQAFLVKPYRIPSESMVPTLEIGQRVLVNRIGARFGHPQVGDVVVFHPPTGAEQGNECGGGPPPQGQVCIRPTSREGGRQLHQACRGGAGRQDQDLRRPRDPQREDAERAVRASRASATTGATSPKR